MTTNLPHDDSSSLEDFIRRTQELAGVGSYNEAHQLARATVRTLGSTISGGEAEKLGEWLPETLQSELGEKNGQAGRFDKLNFLDKVGGLIHSVDRESVETQVRGTLRALRAEAPSEEIDDTIAQLPPELAALFR